MELGDRKIPAIKLFVCQLDKARKPLEANDILEADTSSLVGLKLEGLEFTRVWLQGTVVDVNTSQGTFVVDDGTGTITALMPTAGLDVSTNAAGNDGNAAGIAGALPMRGHQMLLVGAVEIPPDGEQHRSSCRRYRVLCDVIKDVGAESPNRDTLWGLEVIDFWRSRQRDISAR